MPAERALTRRSVLRALGAVAWAGTLAGCTTQRRGESASGGSPTDGAGTTTSTTATGTTEDGGPGSVDEFLADTSNYDGVADRTGTDGVTVAVGTEANGAFFGFDPPAVRVGTGATVTWEWTGDGGPHSVSAVAGADFDSRTTATEGHTFQWTAGDPGTAYYVCEPHRGTGMKGVVVVE